MIRFVFPLLLAAPMGAQVRTLTATPSRSVVGDFTYVGSMVIGADGGVLVTQPSDARLLLITSAPAPRVIGRRGAGPNEFQYIGRAGLTGGRYWAYDEQLRRITFIEPSGVLGPSQLVEGLAGKPALRGFMTPSLAAVVTPDSLLVAASADGSGMLGMIELAERHFLITGAGQLAMREVTRHPAAPNCAVIRGNAVSRIATCTAPRTALRPDGRQLVTAIVTFGDKPVITITSTALSGVRGYTLTLPFAPRPISAAARDSSRAAMQKLAPGGDFPAFPTAYDPISGMVVSNEGELWLTMSAPRGEPRTIWRISASGKMLGQFRLANFTLEAASGDLLWGTSTDADDVLTLVQYRVK
jgi:hypothetical protein